MADDHHKRSPMLVDRRSVMKVTGLSSLGPIAQYLASGCADSATDPPGTTGSDGTDSSSDGDAESSASSEGQTGGTSQGADSGDPSTSDSTGDSISTEINHRWR